MTSSALQRAEQEIMKRMMTPSQIRERGIVPESMPFKLKFTSTFKNASANFVAYGAWLWRLNSIYGCQQTLPDRDAAAGHNEWANFYNRYKVTGAYVEVDTYATITLTEQNQIVTMFPCVNPTTPEGRAELAVTYPGAKSIFIAPLAASSTLTTAGAQARMTKFYKIADLFGTSIEDEDYSAEFYDVPGKEAFLNISFCSLDQSTNKLERTDSVVSITYYGYFSSPKNLPLS